MGNPLLIFLNCSVVARMYIYQKNRKLVGFWEWSYLFLVKLVISITQNQRKIKLEESSSGI